MDFFRINPLKKEEARFTATPKIVSFSYGIISIGVTIVIILGVILLIILYAI